MSSPARRRRARTTESLLGMAMAHQNLPCSVPFPTAAASPLRPLPLPPPPPLPAPTTIIELGDDLLREIFLRLPDVTTLARAAFACRAFLHAVRSSPAFRRRFRQLRAPPLLALFRAPDIRAIVPAAAGKSSDIAAAFDGLLQDSVAGSESEWRSHTNSPYYNGYACFVSRATGRRFAFYSLHSRALNIYPKNFRCGNDGFLEFHTLSPGGEEDQPSRVVCIHRDRAWAWARVAVFSSHTMEWQVVLLKMEMVFENDTYGSGTVVNGFVCWVHKEGGCILALNTATFQFSRMDLPPPLKVSFSRFRLGHTKDGEFCAVDIQCMLSVWLWAADDDGVERFMLHNTFSLRANVTEITECSEEADVAMWPMAVINGFVYLSLTVDYIRYPQSPEWYLSFGLETAVLNLLHKESNLIWCPVDPYIMVSWPSCLIHGKEDLEARVTGNISEDDGLMGTEEASPVLFTALKSFKEQLIDDGNLSFAEIDSFLLDDERNTLLNRITTLESGLVAARDSVLRMSTKSDGIERTERVSCWQMFKLMFGRVCSRFFFR